MQRFALLILALLLMADLMKDGGLGRVSPFLPNYSIKTSFVSLDKADSGKAESRHTLRLTESPEIPLPWPIQPVMVEMQQPLKIIDFCHTGGSGGIPLEIPSHSLPGQIS